MNLNVILFLVFANFLIFAAALLENRGDEVKIVQKRASAGNNGKKVCASNI